MFKYSYSAKGCSVMMDEPPIEISGFIESHNQLTDSEIKLMAYADHPQYVFLVILNVRRFFDVKQK